MQRACKFFTNHLYHSIVGREIIQTLTDIFSMQLPANRVCSIIKQFRHEDAFISSIRNWFRKTGIIYIISGAPWKICIVSTGLNNIMLKIILMDQQQSFLVSQVSKL